MLLDKVVEVKWNGRNIKYYKEKGYIYTKTGDTFFVKIEDLYPNARCKVNVKCDSCGKLKKVIYRDFMQRRYDGYYCSNCAYNLYGKNTMNKNYLDNSISFAEYYIQNIDSNFIEKYWSNKNTENPFEICYKSSKKVWIKCQIKDYHDDYYVNCDGFVEGRRCPYCTSRKIHKLDSLGAYICNKFNKNFIDCIWSDKNKESIYNISVQNGKCFWWKCVNGKHKDFKCRVADMVNSDFHCRECSAERNESYLQESVRKFLEHEYHQYNILHEYNCSCIPVNPKTKYKMPFDNEIKELKLIIETNGIQHYEITGLTILSADKSGRTHNDELKYQQRKDNFKKNYAISNGYYYLEIPYWAKKDNLYIDLINNKIKEILHNENVR